MKFILLIFLCFLCSCGEKKSAEQKVGEHLANDEVTGVKKGDPKMEAAIQEARGTVDEFIKVLHSKDQAYHDLSIKIPLEDGEEVEHLLREF